MRVAWADIDIKARQERKEREITCIRRVAPLLAVITSPVLAILSARDVMPIAMSGPLMLTATVIQLSSLWRLHSAERIAHSLIASDGPVRPIEKSLGDLARWTEAVAHRSAPTHPISGLPTREHFLGAVETHISANRGSRMLATVRFADFDRIAAFDQEGAHAALASLAQRLASGRRRRQGVPRRLSCGKRTAGGSMNGSAAGLSDRPLSFRSASRSRAGHPRTPNQDRVLDRDDARLWAVADGMGGHRDGARASGLLIDALSKVAHGASGFAFLAEAERSVLAVNTELIRSDDERCGSTLVMLIAHDDHYACLWAGDSRAYQLRGGEIAQISRDHSVVQALVESGAVREADRRQHPDGNVITRAVGASADLKLDRRFARIMPGDRFLLCSDGLTACIDDDELAAAAATSLSAGAAADRLMRLAASRAARDDASLVVIDASDAVIAE